MRKIWSNHIVKYVFFGGATTALNFIVFWILREWAMFSVTFSNVLAIGCAMVFAFIVNAKFVFQSSAQTVKERLREFKAFVSARLGTMCLEVVGVWVMVDLWHWQDLWSKAIINGVVLVLNYLFSRLIFIAGDKSL